jgi:hypothetical protein
MASFGSHWGGRRESAHLLQTNIGFVRSVLHRDGTPANLAHLQIGFGRQVAERSALPILFPSALLSSLVRGIEPLQKVMPRLMLESACLQLGFVSQNALGSFSSAF